MARWLTTMSTITFVVAVDEPTVIVPALCDGSKPHRLRKQRVATQPRFVRVGDGVDDEFVDLQFVGDVEEFVADFFWGAYDVAGELGFGLV